MGGRLDFREEGDEHGLGSVCLTYEFEDLGSAARAAEVLRQLGEHAEGPADYRPLAYFCWESVGERRREFYGQFHASL